MKNFSKSKAKEIWLNYFDDKLVARDWFGSLIELEQYGEDTNHGWEIDHIYPKAKGGSSSDSNLQPLMTLNNREKDNNLSGVINGKKFKVISDGGSFGNIVGKMSS